MYLSILVQTTLTVLMHKVAIIIAYSLMFTFHSVGASKGHESYQDHSISMTVYYTHTHTHTSNIAACGEEGEEVWGETVPGKLLLAT